MSLTDRIESLERTNKSLMEAVDALERRMDALHEEVFGKPRKTKVDPDDEEDEEEEPEDDEDDLGFWTYAVIRGKTVKYLAKDKKGWTFDPGEAYVYASERAADEEEEIPPFPPGFTMGKPTLTYMTNEVDYLIVCGDEAHGGPREWLYYTGKPLPRGKYRPHKDRPFDFWSYDKKHARRFDTLAQAEKERAKVKPPKGFGRSAIHDDPESNFNF